METNIYNKSKSAHRLCKIARYILYKTPSEMDVAPWIDSKLDFDGIGWYYMAFNCNQWYLMVFNGNSWYSIVAIQWNSMVLQAIS